MRIQHRSGAIVKNGRVRPGPKTNSGQAWECYDVLDARLGRPPFRKEAVDAAAKLGLNKTLANGQFTYWRIFNGITDRLQAPGKTGKQSHTDADSNSEISPFAKWVENKREAKGMTVPELAEMSGLSTTAIYKIEAGTTTNIRKATKEQLEKALGETVTKEIEKVMKQESEVVGIGSLEDFDPHLDDERPPEPGIYVLYDISERPIYVGEGVNVRKRIRDHEEKFWFKKPIVNSASWIRIPDDKLRIQIETLLIKFLKKNAVINKQNVDR